MSAHYAYYPMATWLTYPCVVMCFLSSPLDSLCFRLNLGVCLGKVKSYNMTAMENPKAKKKGKKSTTERTTGVLTLFYMLTKWPWC